VINFRDQDIFLVTGASSGIGRECCLLLNKLGAAVIAVGRRGDKLNELRSETMEPKLLYTEIKDLSVGIEEHDKWIGAISARYGRLRGIVLSAGIQHTIPLKAISYDQMKQLFDVNYFSNIMLTKGFGHSKVNVGKGASIVFVSSITAKHGGKGIINYSASKAALLAAVKSLALELCGMGIRVNSVLPGYVETEMLTGDKNLFNAHFIEKINAEYPLGIGKPEWVAQLIIFLLSNCASWITGSNIIIDGGASLG
jgi:NAD(P)-dependent dehydrogenase (short-subunit alcohol dehydrogenase family)